MFGIPMALALRLLAVIALVLSVLGGIAYLKHEGAMAQKEKDMQQLRERNETERIQSEEIWNTALTRVTEAKKTDQRNYEGALLSYAKLNENLSAARAADAERVRRAERTGSAKSDRNPASGKTDLPGACSEPTGGTGQEIPAEIQELAGLALIAASHIRENANVR